MVRPSRIFGYPGPAYHAPQDAVGRTGSENAAGQDALQDDYFNLSGITYSTGPYGSVNSNYYTTQMGYDANGNEDRVLAPTGTITRMVYDSLNRKLSTWVGTNDTPATGQWSPSNNTSPANMVEVSSDVYDGGGVGDGNLTQETQYPGGSAPPRVTQWFFDWRDRAVAEKSGVQSNENDNTNRPIYYTTYDNLDEAISQATYTGDGVTITTPQSGAQNGVPQAPAANLLRAYSTTEYDDQQRVYQTNTYDVNPTTGAYSASISLNTNYYYDHRGELIATSSPGGLWQKKSYDGAGRVTVEYMTDGASGTTWADASSPMNDIVQEQVETYYDANGNPIETIHRQLMLPVRVGGVGVGVGQGHLFKRLHSRGYTV